MMTKIDKDAARDLTAAKGAGAHELTPFELALVTGGGDPGTQEGRSSNARTKPPGDSKL